MGVVLEYNMFALLMPLYVQYVKSKSTPAIGKATPKSVEDKVLTCIFSVWIGNCEL